MQIVPTHSYRYLTLLVTITVQDTGKRTHLLIETKSIQIQFTFPLKCSIIQTSNGSRIALSALLYKPVLSALLFNNHQL